MSASDLQHPDKYFNVAIFLLFVFVGSLVGFIVSMSAAPGPELSYLIMLYLSGLAMGWFALSGSKSSGRLERAISILLLGSPVIVMVASLSTIPFWLSLIAFSVLAVRSSLAMVAPKTPSEEIFVSLYSVWIIAGFIITLGGTSFLPFAQSSFDLGSIIWFFNLRLLLTLILLTALIAKAMLDAYKGPSIQVPSLPNLSFNTGSDSESALDSVLKPVTIVLNGILVVLQKLTMVLWAVLYYFVVFLYRAGVNLAQHLYELVTNSMLLRSIFRVAVSFIMLVVFGVLVSALAPAIVDYLRADTSFFAITSNSLLTFVVTFVLLMATTLIITAAYYMWDLTDEPLSDSAHGGSMVLLGTAISSLVLYLISKSGLTEVQGFTSLGLYTVLMVGFILIVFCYQIVRKIGADSPEPVPQPTEPVN